MQILRLQIQLNFLLIIFAYGQENQQIFCEEDQITFFKLTQYPAYFNYSTKDYQIKESINFLEIIQTSNIQQQSNNYNLIHIQEIGDEILRVYKNENQYYIERSQIQLHFYQNQNLFNLYNSINFQINFQLPQCNKFHSIYQKQLQFLVICEQENTLIIYIIDSKSLNSTLKTISINKIDDECSLSINQQNHDKSIYISFTNCLNWIIYVIDFESIQEFIMHNTFLQGNILRSVLVQVADPFFIFDHQIYSITKDSQISKIYENFNRKILTCSKMMESLIIIFEQQDNEEIIENENIFLIFITRKEKPKQILELNNKIILHYENYIEHLETKTLSFKLYQKVDRIFIVNFQNKYIFGFNFTQLVIFKQNTYSPFFNCNQYQNQNNISFLLSQFQYNNEITVVDIVKNNSDPFELFSNYSFIEKILNQEFQITFDKQKILNYGAIPIITPLNNEELKCNLKLDKITCINQYLESIKWFLIKKFIDGSYGILFQQRKNLYFLKCKSQTLICLGVFQDFQSNNIFSYQHFIILRFSNNTKILLIEVSTSIEYRLLEFQEQILEIQVFNFQLIIILESCKIFSLVSPLTLVQIKINNFYLSKTNCRNMHYLHDQIQCFYNESTLIVFEIFITTTIMLNGLKINNIIKIQLSQNIYLIEEQRQDIIILSKQAYFNQQFIKLNELPKLYFEYSQPLNYVLNNNFLVVAAKANDTRVLLIYSLQTKKRNSLIQIIDVDYFSFHFIDNDYLVYIYQNQIYQQNIGKITLICSTQFFFEFNKNLQLPIQVQFKSNIIQTRIQNINISLVNCIENLTAFNTTKIQLNEEDANKIIWLDPRKYVTGPLNKISSQNDSIILPIQIIHNIDFAECTIFTNSICINTEENYVILNILENKQRIYVSQINQTSCHYQNGLYFLIEDQQFTIKIEIYNQVSELLSSVSLFYNCNNRKHIHVIDDTLIIICNYEMTLYMINQNSIIYIGQLEIQLLDIQIINVKNENNSFVIYHFELKAEFIIYIKVYENQIISKRISLLSGNNYQVLSQIHLLEIECNLNVLDQQKQIQLKLIIQSSNSFGYLYLATLDFKQLQLQLISQLGIIRYSQCIEPSKVLILSTDILLFIKNNNYPIMDLIMYNISKIQEFNFLDEIYHLAYERFSLSIYNSSIAFLTLPSNKKHQVLKFSFYKLNLTTIDSYCNITLKFENRISNLEFEVEFQKQSQSFRIKCVMLLIYLNAFLLFFWLLFKDMQIKKKQINRNFREEIQIEI